MASVVGIFEREGVCETRSAKPDPESERGSGDQGESPVKLIVILAAEKSSINTCFMNAKRSLSAMNVEKKGPLSSFVETSRKTVFTCDIRLRSLFI